MRLAIRHASTAKTEQGLNGRVVAPAGYNAMGRMSAVTHPDGVGADGNGTAGVFFYGDQGRPAAVTSDEVTSRDQVNRIVGRSIDGFDPK